MITFINFLRALAACLITNAHYTGIYPTDLIANGGLLGDVLFFAVSGYCLYNVKKRFLPWYGKRIWRVYLPVVVMTFVYMLLGAYWVTLDTALWWYVYPTYYHFVGSIIVLYVPYYLVLRVQWTREHLPAVMAVIAAAYLAVYLTVYDCSSYHIDNVREPMIRFLFFESMLLGAWFREKDGLLRGRVRIWHYGALLVLTAAYFSSKLLFSRRASLAVYQPVNQVFLLGLLYMLFRIFSGLDSKLENAPRWLRKTVDFISGFTLEIYLVQYVLVDKLRPLGHFPLNWLALTGSILASAWVLHWVCGLIYRGADMIVKRIGRKQP